MATAWLFRSATGGSVFGLVAPLAPLRVLHSQYGVPLLDLVDAFSLVLVFGLVLMAAFRVGSVIRNSINDFALIRRLRRRSNREPSWQAGAAQRLRTVQSTYEELCEQLRPHLLVETASKGDDSRATLSDYRTSLTELQSRLARICEADSRGRH